MPRPNTRGFTLLEIVVVLAVVGIMIGTAVLYIQPPSAEKLRQQAAEELWAVSQAARDEAIMLRRVLGIHLEEDGYQLQVRSNKNWSSPPDDPIYRMRSLPVGLEIRINELASGLTSFTLDESDEERLPQVLFLPNGEVSPFEIAVVDQDGSGTQVFTDEYNEIQLR